MGMKFNLVTFADDVTTFVCDKPSHLTLINVINLFGTYSGLKINHEKTEILLLSNKEVAVRNFELEGTKFKKTIKILGVHFTYNTSLFCKLNFESIEKSLKNVQKGWGWERFNIDRKSANYTIVFSAKDFI